MTGVDREYAELPSMVGEVFGAVVNTVAKVRVSWFLLNSVHDFWTPAPRLSADALEAHAHVLEREARGLLDQAAELLRQAGRLGELARVRQLQGEPEPT